MVHEYHKYTSYKDVEDLKRLDFIVDSVKSIKNPKAKILDVGCGNGNISMALGSLGYNVLGVDIDRSSIDKASANNTFSNVRFEVYDANAFGMKEEFDAIVCSEVLEHLKQPEQLVESLYSLLKKDGVFIATVPNGWGPRELFITKPMQWLHTKKLDQPLFKLKRILGYSGGTLQSSNPDLTHIKFFTRSTLKRMMHNAGFKPYRFQNADFVERVFPYSMLTRRMVALQKLDCKVSDFLPHQLSSGIYSSWKK
jgi:2-polyprenyl-3-methyl-5-hydroxy-6-metoxy-1,4-benzoquinol methylase